MSTIAIECACGWKRAVSAELIGKRVRCRECSKPVAVELQLEAPALVPVAATVRTPRAERARPSVLRGRPVARPAGKRGGAGWFAGLGVTFLLVGLGAAGRAARNHTDRATTSVAATAAWGRHASPQGGFSIEMPEKPRVMLDSPEGTPVHGLRLETGFGRSLFGVNSVALPEPIEGATVDAVFAALEQVAIDGLKPAAKGPVRVTARQRSTFAGQPAHEMHFEFVSIDGPRAHGRARHLIVDGKRFVEALVFSAEGSVSPEVMAHFLDTLRLDP